MKETKRSEEEEMKQNMVENIIEKISYPNRLLRGLDDIDLDNIRDYLLGDRVFAVGIRMTNRCNYNCIYCGTAERRGTDAEKCLKTEEYIDIVNDAKSIGASTIVLGGNGEPTFHKEIVEILTHINERKMTPIIFTNGYIFGDDILCKKIHGISGKELLNVIDKTGTSVIISCETTNEDRYNKIVGTDSYGIFMNAIARIRKTNLVKKEFYKGIPLCRIAFSTVVMPINYNDCNVLSDFVHELNGLCIFKLPSLHGAAAANATMMFDPEEGNKIRKELYDLSDKQATLQILNLACVAWSLGISINNEGFYMSCMTDESNPYGPDINVRNTSMKELLGKRKELIALSNTICPIKDKYYV